MNLVTMQHRPIASGISILEVLISMGILAVGLLSVAALFPVGQHYVLSAERFDRGAAVGQAAFNDLRTRGMLYPEVKNWKQANGDPFPTAGGRTDLSGISLAVDPLWCSVNYGLGMATFPPGNSYSPSAPIDPPVMARAMILPSNTPPATAAEWELTWRLFENVFTSHDDLIGAFPEDPDVPSFQLFKKDTGTNSSVYRQYAGDYSWMFTVVPETNHDDGLYHTNASQIDLYRVSVVVFYKRQLEYTDPTVDPNQPERLVDIGPEGIGVSLGEGLGSGEIQLKSRINPPIDLEGMNAGEWLMLSGWQPVNIGGVIQHRPLFRWYRIVAVGNEIEAGPAGPTRRVTVVGPDWNRSYPTWVTLLDGVVAVYEKTMRIDEF